MRGVIEKKNKQNKHKNPPTPKHLRKQRQVLLLQEKNDKQENLIVSIRAHNNLDRIHESVATHFPPQITTLSPPASA